MRLLSIQVDGYKRFETAQLFYAGQRVIAVVGPNEAGKTSLLGALSHVTDGVEFERREFTGRERPDAAKEIVRARYEIELADRGDLEDVLDSSASYTFDLAVRADGGIRWNINPYVRRNLVPRNELRDLLTRAREGDGLMAHVLPEEDDESDEAAEATEPDTDSVVIDAVEGVLQMLDSAAEDLDEEEQSRLVELRGLVSARIDELSNRDLGDELIREIDRVASLEAQANPRNRLYPSLRPRVPAFLLFDNDQLLQSDYAWADGSDAPDGLANLLFLARASYEKYRELALDRDRRDELSTYERQANRELKERLSVWSQRKLTINLRADPESLAVHVIDEETDRDVPIEERSAGLQMFAAVLAYCARHADTVPPILLFDEAETHLHYGAQADLVQVFEQQDVAQAIIYTTHSVGCLPEDLGRAIRVVAPIGNESSEIRNEFWSGGVGLTPLTLAMGASALAILPARYALIGEGPTEAILLPSLFRQAREPRFLGAALGFQIAPGAAEVSATAAPELETEAGNVAYLFDADDGGRKHAAKLSKRALNEGRVFILGEDAEAGLCTEDLVAASNYVAAVNQVISRTRSTEARISESDLPTVARAAALEDWCARHGIEPLSKTLIAESALREGQDSGTLIEPARKELVLSLYRSVRKTLGLRVNPRGS